MRTRRTGIKNRSEGGLTRRGGLALLRRAREDDRGAQPQAPPAPPEEAEPTDRGARERPRQEPYDERRWREAGGPEDVAQYTCSCGFVFEAPVSASVACPNCGAGQAW
jgi:hypothetical protein